jgi:O-antigen ligase
MTTIEADDSKISARLVEWWGRGVFAFLCFSILLLAVGRFEFPLSGASFSAWSVSRTTFFFWLIWKILIWFRLGRRNLGLNKNSFPLALLAFFAVVTASLLPDFHEAADYRYLFFAVMHCLMVLDLFAEGERPKLLLLFLGLLPGMLVIRGILYNPSVLNFSLVNRFGYPLAHPNPAGLLLAMSIPLALAVIASQKGWLRGVTLASLAAQFTGLILTYSRGAWLACLVSLLGVSLMEGRLRKGVFALGLLGLIVFVAVAPLRRRLMTLVNPTADAAIEGRLGFMAGAVTVALENPFLGFGYGRDRLREGVKKFKADSEQLGFIPHSHNMYTELLAETGIVGLSVFMWMICSNLSRLIRRARRESSPQIRILYFCLSASLIAFLVGILGDAPFYNHDTRIFFFTLLALTYLFLRRDLAGHSGRE